MFQWHTVEIVKSYTFMQQLYNAQKMIQQSKERMKEKDEEHKMFNEKPD